MLYRIEKLAIGNQAGEKGEHLECSLALDSQTPRVPETPNLKKHSWLSLPLQMDDRHEFAVGSILSVPAVPLQPPANMTLSDTQVS